MINHEGAPSEATDFDDVFARRVAKLSDWQRADFMPKFMIKLRGWVAIGPGLLAISSVIIKLFEKILDRRIQVWSERVGLLYDLQWGFQAGRGTVDHGQLFSLNEIIPLSAVRGRWLLFALLMCLKHIVCG